MKKLIDDIKRHEGYRDHVYLDSLGYPTCGYGHHLSVGSKINETIAEEFLQMDIKEAFKAFCELPRKYRRQLNEARARVVMNMLYNMGKPTTMRFVRMWDAIERGDFEKAAEEMLDSRWHTQVGRRAEELAEVMRTGKDKDEEVK